MQLGDFLLGAFVCLAAATRHFPHLRIFARAFDRVHSYQLINAGVADVFREVFASSADMGEKLLATLGHHPFEAHRAVKTFKIHDEQLLRASAKHADDREKLVDIYRAGRAEISKVLSTDRAEANPSADHAWEAPDKTRE